MTPPPPAPRDADLRIDGARLWRDLEASAAIGPGAAGGLSRLALSPADAEMRRVFAGWCRGAGLAVRVDRFGNMFARRPGREPDARAVLIGSHLDTQITGGRYDGVLGVLAGLEVVRTLDDAGRETRRPIEIVNWTNEEGVRFQPPMLGSGAFVGAHDADWALAQADEDGVTLAAALERAGFAGDAAPRPEDYDGCFELHIEQGPELEAAGAPVGVVAGAFTSFGADILVRGENAHTGPTPMSARRNALLGAAVIIAELDAIAWAFQPHGRSACARIAAAPNRYGVLAHRAEITVDVRHADPTAAAAMFERVRALPELARRRAGTPAEIVKSWSFGADLAFDPGLRAEITAAAAALGVACREMTSIAGHDAYHLARAAPTALIFSPCRGGVTHNEAESITLEATEPAVNVLLHAALRRADRA